MLFASLLFNFPVQIDRTSTFDRIFLKSVQALIGTAIGAILDYFGNEITIITAT